MLFLLTHHASKHNTCVMVILPSNPCAAGSLPLAPYKPVRVLRSPYLPLGFFLAEKTLLNMHLWKLALVIGSLTLRSYAQSTTKVELGNTTILGTSQGFSGIGVDFFGGNYFTVLAWLILNCLS